MTMEEAEQLQAAYRHDRRSWSYSTGRPYPEDRDPPTGESESEDQEF